MSRAIIKWGVGSILFAVTLYGGTMQYLEVQANAAIERGPSKDTLAVVERALQLQPYHEQFTDEVVALKVFNKASEQFKV
ncbi:MAG: hypothetical protein ACRC5C_03845, partial [Bacilli bacterium]